MAEIQQPENSEGSQTQPNPPPKSVDLNVGGNIDGNVVIGDNNIINNYFPVVEKNTEKHEPDFWALKHPYPMPPNFTGRIAERATLTHWLKEDSENRLFILRALGGFGKSALSWQWLTHDVDIKEYPKVLWWSFYEGDANFEHFAEETLKYLKLDIPQGQRPQVDELLKAMQGQKILLIMDGFERALRAYSSMNAAYQGDEPKVEDNQLDCVNINAEFFLKGVCSLPNIESKVLMTTRLTPRAVKPRGEFMLGCREEKLEAMQKADAVEFFHKQKIKGTHAEIEAACAPYGYHPLSLRILAGLIIDDRKTPGDISVANKLEITDDIIQNKHHVLEVAYNTLLPEQQNLLSTIACFRSRMNYDVLKEISSKTLGKGKKVKADVAKKLDDNLRTLETRGLLHWDRKANKYDLHPIVRRYAYERLTIPDRTAAHTRLRDYFAAVDAPAKPQTLDDLAPVIELYHHMVKAEKLDEACDLFYERINKPTYYQFGAYQLRIELLRGLFPDGEDKPPRLKKEDEQAWTLNSLANSYAASGQPRRAVHLLEMTNEIYENKMKNKRFLAIGVGNLAHRNRDLGALREAERNLRRRIDLSREIVDEGSEGIGHYDRGIVLAYVGQWNESEKDLRAGEEIKKKTKHMQSQSVIGSYRALCFLLMARSDPQSKITNQKSAIQSASRAVELAEERHKNIGRPNIRDYIRAYWLLGAAYRANGDLTKAEENLSKAISMCRQINYVMDESAILLNIARLRYDQKKYEEAKSLAEEALSITERCGYVLQGADVNLFLAQYALEQEKDKVKAKEYAKTALKLAYCDGPPYYYKVAYEEAERMLENLK